MTGMPTSEELEQKIKELEKEAIEHERIVPGATGQPGESRIENRLMASESNYRELFNASNDAIFVHDLTTGIVLDVNQTACEMFGRPRQELLHLSLVAVSPGDPPYTVQNAERLIQKAVEEGPQTFEWLSMRKNEERFWVEVNLKRAVIGRRRCILAFVRDITDRKRIEEELRLDESRLSTLLELNQMTGAPMKELTNFVMEEGIRLTKSKIGYLAFMNEDETVLKIHSWSKSAMKECDIEKKQIVYPIEFTGLWGEAVRRRKPIITNDYQAPNPLKKGYPHGHVKIVSHMNIPVFDGGRIVAVAGVGNKEEGYDASDVRQLTLLMDGMFKIIQHKRTGEETRRLQNLLGNIIDSMPSLIVAVDKDCRVTQWNHGAGKATGLSMERARGRGLADVLPGLDREMEKVRRAIDEGRTQKSVRVSHRMGGEMRLVDIIVYPLIDGDDRGAVIRVDDVTEKAHMEEMMIQSEKMLSVGGLAAGMAHEIKNPLGGILQNTQVLKNRIFGDLPQNRRVARECGVSMAAMRSYMEKRGVVRMATSIMESGVRAARIIENVLSFSRKSESRFSPRDLRELMDQTVEIAKTDYNLKK
ncbi:MAG: PAS domain S-box protein, partial [Desulfobacterales bacterium]|nr:PAS domain S-box protein [Desulfobacterales bacterium]